MRWGRIGALATVCAVAAATPGAGDALMAQAQVKVTPTGPAPRTVVIPVWEVMVTWVDQGTSATRVRIQGTNCHPEVSRGTSYQGCWFRRAGRHPYRIEGLPADVASGVIVVQRVRRAPTLAAERRAVTFGAHLSLSGLVPTNYFPVPVSELRERVAVLSRTSGSRYRMLSSTISGLPVPTRGNLGWQIEVAPARRTTYVARLLGEPQTFVNLPSRPVTVEVRPRVTLMRDGRVRVEPGRAYAGRIVVLRRLDGRLVQRTTLDAHGRAAFRLPHGTTVHAAVGPAAGYLRGVSALVRA